jgi:hypothetical protein
MEGKSREEGSPEKCHTALFEGRPQLVNTDLETTWTCFSTIFHRKNRRNSIEQASGERNTFTLHTGS